jgi:hypothetical protein
MTSLILVYLHVQYERWVLKDLLVNTGSRSKELKIQSSGFIKVHEKKALRFWLALGV